MLEEKLRNREFAEIFHFQLHAGNTLVIDLSKNNPDPALKKLKNTQDLEDYIQDLLDNNQKDYAVGGYGEDRVIYRRFPHFSPDSENERSVHLGIDIWCPSGEAVHCPMEASVHSIGNNDAPGDYGGTVILSHEMDGDYFHTLYGHLSYHSIKNLTPGDKLKPAESFATIGERSENVDWPTHLHFQIIRDLEGHEGDYPGVCNPSKREHFLKNCPDPNLILGLEV